MASDRLVNVLITPVLEYHVRGLTIHDKIAPTGLRPIKNYRTFIVMILLRWLQIESKWVELFVFCIFD